MEEEHKLYTSLRKKIQDSEKPIKIDEYKNFVVRKFLVDVDGFFDLFPDDDIEELLEGVNAAYEAIINLYPPFSLTSFARISTARRSSLVSRSVC